MIPSDPGSVLAHLLLTLVGGGLCLWFGSRKGVLAPTMTAFAAHLTVACGFFLSVGLWAPDAMHYDRLAVALSERWFEGSPYVPRITSGKEGFPTMLGVLYGMFGHHPFLGVLVNVTLATLVVPTVASTARVLNLPVRLSAWLAALAPPFVLWGSLLLREAPSWFLLSLIVRGLAGVASESSGTESWAPLKNWFLVLAPLAPLVTIRGTAAILIGAAALFAFAITARNRTLPVLIGLVALVPAAQALASTGSTIAGGYDVAAINQQRAALSRSASTSFEVKSYENTADMLLNAPVVTLRGLFGPFPWELPSVGAFLAADALLWWTIVACCIVAFWKSARKVQMLCMILPALAMIAVLSITSGNYGTMSRLRYQAAIMVLPLVAQGVESLVMSRKSLVPATSLTLIDASRP